MLKARFEQSGSALTAVTVSGHAAYTEDSPEGMVLCAAVSSAMQLTCNSLTECLKAEVEITQAPDPGVQNLLAFRLTSPDSVQSALMQGLLIHLQALSEDYPKLLSVKVTQVRRL